MDCDDIELQPQQKYDEARNIEELIDKYEDELERQRDDEDDDIGADAKKKMDPSKPALHKMLKEE